MKCSKCKMEEEIEGIKKLFERNLKIISSRMVGSATEITMIKQPMILLFRNLILKLEQQQNEIYQLEISNQKLIEKLK